MTEATRVWVEVLFNISYLVVVWSLVILMTARYRQVHPGDQPLVKRIIGMFALLALGDTGHVGFRVVAYTLGGLEQNPVLVGLGALSTAYTATLFYMLLVDVWRLRFQKPLGRAGWTLLFAGLARLAVMAFPQNQWQQVVAPYDWSLLRNAFLTVQGLGVMALILRDAARAQDRTFQWIGGMVALSFTFYAPVILWVNVMPVLGMLMIPKTLAYLGVAIIAYRAFFPAKRAGLAAAR